jgi:ABC-type polysaccharide transport system permease subunit
MASLMGVRSVMTATETMPMHVATVVLRLLAAMELGALTWGKTSMVMKRVTTEIRFKPMIASMIVTSPFAVMALCEPALNSAMMEIESIKMRVETLAKQTIYRLSLRLRSTLYR